jgi:broad specificity phosphatase PhoE
LGRKARQGAKGAAMTRIILVRHGHVDWLAPERFRGYAELPLADRGRPRTLDALE